MRCDNLTCLASILLAAAVSVSIGSRLQAADWLTAPSYYSHDPHTGQRVQQYSPIGPFYTFARGDYQRSVYRQTRSSIQVGGSVDHMHVVEEWGKAVRPYGEWRFPYRPYSVPYHLWAPHHPSFPGGGFRGGPHRPAARGDRHRATDGPTRDDEPFHAYPGYAPQPWDDGRYPPYDAEGPYGYPDLLLRRAPRPSDDGSDES